MSDEINDLRAENAELSGQVGRLEARVAELEAENQRMAQELRQERVRHSTDLASRDSQIDALNERIRFLEQENRELHSTLRAVQREIVEVRAELNKVRRGEAWLTMRQAFTAHVARLRVIIAGGATDRFGGRGWHATRLLNSYRGQDSTVNMTAEEKARFEAELERLLIDADTPDARAVWLSEFGTHVHRMALPYAHGNGPDAALIIASDTVRDLDPRVPMLLDAANETMFLHYRDFRFRPLLLVTPQDFW